MASLRKLGVAVLACADARECELVLKLHSSSVSLFVGHDEEGARMNELIKTNRRFAHIPVVLTTSKWTERQCADHQATPMGANAYARTPVDEHEFLSLIDQIFGTELAHGRGFNVSDELSAVDTIAPVEALEVAPVIPIAPAPIEAVEVSPGIELSPASPSAPSASVTPASFGNPTIQVEDAAALYGAATPGQALDDELRISLDAPSSDLTGESAPSAGEDGGTKEFRIEAALGADPVASPVLATPIEAAEPAAEEPSFDGITIATDPSAGTRELSPASLDVPRSAEEDAPFHLGETAPSIDFGTSSHQREPEYLRGIGSIGDDQPTRVAVSQIAAGTGAYAPGSSDEIPSEPESTIAHEPRAPAPAPRAHAPVHDDLDADALSTMPYLGKSTQFATNPLGHREPMDDAVVPGGAANAPDIETLKKYLYLREQDVSALSAQLRQARERVSELEGALRHEKAVTSEFAHLAQEQDRRIADFEKEKAIALEEARKELEETKFEMKRRSEKIRVMELHVREATEATERLKERVRNDIRKIRSREKELENRLEIMKKDSEALLAARENKIIELKRKLDLVEFNTDLLQDQLDKERKASAALREKLAKAAQIVRVAGGILTPEEEAMIAGAAPAGDAKIPAA